MSAAQSRPCCGSDRCCSETTRLITAIIMNDDNNTRTCAAIEPNSTQDAATRSSRRAQASRRLSLAIPAGKAAFARQAGAWDKVLPQSNLVQHEKATFPNRFWISLSGNANRPRDPGLSCRGESSGEPHCRNAGSSQSRSLAPSVTGWNCRYLAPRSSARRSHVFLPIGARPHLELLAGKSGDAAPRNSGVSRAENY